MAEIDPKLAEQLNQAEPTAEEAFEAIAAGKKKKKSDKKKKKRKSHKFIESTVIIH